MTHNRLSAPLPDSIMDRYFAEHPEEEDFRNATPKVAAVEREEPTPEALEKFFRGE
jgi:hypothetical protein